MYRAFTGTFQEYVLTQGSYALRLEFPSDHAAIAVDRLAYAANT